MPLEHQHYKDFTSSNDIDGNEGAYYMAANSYLDELTIEQTIIESLLANEKTHPDEIKEKVDTNERKVNNTQIVKITGSEVLIDKLESLSTKIASLRSELFTLFLRKKNIELHTAIQQIEDLVGDVSKDNELKFTKFFRNSLHFKTKIIDKLSNLKAEVDAAGLFDASLIEKYEKANKEAIHIYNTQSNIEKIKRDLGSSSLEDDIWNDADSWFK